MAVPAIVVVPATKLIVGVLVRAAASKFGGMKGEALAAWATQGLWGLVKWGFSKTFGKISVSSITSWLWQAKDAIYNFNWNISDDQIDAQIKSSFVQLANYTGAAIGQSLGWIGCGVAGTQALAVFNPAAAAHVLDQVSKGEGLAEEALEEISQAWAQVLNSAVRAIASSAFLYGYKSIRKLLKSPGFAPLTKRLLGEKNFQQWGAANAPTVSLRSITDKFLDWLIPIPWLREAVDEMLEELDDSCREATFLIAAEADAFIAQAAQRAATVAMGEQRTVEIVPNREVESETIVLSGRQNVLIPTITTIVATHQMIETRDIGDVIGEGREVREQRNPHSATLKVQWTNKQFPPFKVTGEDYKPMVLNIPDVDRSKLDWVAIKTAMGGVNGVMTGRYKLTGLLSNGSGWCAYGDSHQQCEKLTRDLLYFSNAELVTKNYGYEESTSRRNNALGNLKWIGRVYPHSFMLTHTRTDGEGRQRVLDPSGRKSKMTRNRFELWHATPPPDFQETINEIFRKPATPVQN